MIQEAAGRLIAAASELDAISKQLVQTENAIAGLEPLYEEHIENYVAELWDECINEEKKFPPKDVRDAMAVKAMDVDVKRNYRAHIRLRAKTKARLSDLREIVAAQRSIVSAAKTELEASEGPQPAWSGN